MTRNLRTPISAVVSRHKTALLGIHHYDVPSTLGVLSDQFCYASIQGRKFAPVMLSQSEKISIRDLPMPNESQTVEDCRPHWRNLIRPEMVAR